MYLQSWWAGWGGMRIKGDRLLFLSPRVPAGATSVTLRNIRCSGDRMHSEKALAETHHTPRTKRVNAKGIKKCTSRAHSTPCQKLYSQ